MSFKVCLSSKSIYWNTPKFIYNKFMDLGYFDPCPENPNFNGLDIEWKDLNFVNPPYRDLKKWVDKSILEAKKGKFIILLIPSRTDTKWFRKLYDYGCLFQFIEGRLKFNDKGSAPFPSMFVTLGGCDPLNESKFLLIRRDEIC